MANIIDQYYAADTGLRDAIKTLRTNIQFAGIDQEIRTIALTSSIPGEGKTTVTLFLGIAMAEAGKRTLLVETDCRRPMLGNQLKQRNNAGMLKLLSGEIPLQNAISPTVLKGLYFLDAEPQIVNPVEIISSKKFSGMLTELRRHFDMILFDTPPLGSFIEAALIAAQVDGTILVVQAGRADIRIARRVLDQLKKANARVLGVVLNGVKDTGTRYYRKYYAQNNLPDKKKQPRQEDASDRDTADRDEPVLPESGDAVRPLPGSEKREKNDAGHTQPYHPWR